MNKAWPLEETDEPVVTHACLIGTEGEHRGQVIELSDATKWGRHPQNDVCFSDATVSAFHMQITQVGGGYEVTDLRSKNGTKLNGRWVRQPVLLADQDRIAIGSNAFCFRSPPHAGDEHTAQTSGDNTPSEPSPETREDDEDAWGEELERILSGQSEPVTAPADSDGQIPAATALPGSRRRSAAGKSGGRKTSWTVTCLAFCALQVLIVALVLRSVIGGSMRNTEGGPPGQVASTTAISSQGEQGRAAPFQQIPERQESPSREQATPVGPASYRPATE